MRRCDECKKFFKNCYVEPNAMACDDFELKKSCLTCKHREYDGWDDLCKKFGHVIKSYMNSTCSGYEYINNEESKEEYNE